jgi:hypothetical protein
MKKINNIYIMKNSINNKWTIDLIKNKVKILKNNEVYRIGDILCCSCYNHKNSLLAKEILSKEIYKNTLLYQYFSSNKDFLEILLQNKNKINKYFDNNYIVLHVRTGDDLRNRGLTQNNIDLLVFKLNKFPLNKKVIIITALHYGHSDESELFDSKKFVFTEKNYNTNIQKIYLLISQINHDVYDIISNKDIDLDLLNLVFCENLVASESCGKFAKIIFKYHNEIKKM